MNYLSHKFIILIILFSLSVIPAFSQQPNYEKGVQLYNQKQFKEAVKVFEKAAKQKEAKTDARIWNYLGLSYIQISELKDARKALEKAVKYDSQNAAYRANLVYVCLLEGKYDKALSESEDAIKLDPQNANAYYFRGVAHLWKGELEKAISDADKVIMLDSDFMNAYTLKANSFLYAYGNKWEESETSEDNLDLLKQAIDTLEKCLNECKSSSQNSIQDKISEVKLFYNHFNKKEKSPDYVEMKVLSKPRPGYTDLARSINAQGKILLAVLFDSSGKIGQILVLQGLPGGLTENAVTAVRQIQFEPARENGKPISVVKVIQYNFTIY